MYAEFTEVVTGGLQQGKTRKIVVNLEKILTFREGCHNSGSVLETRRDDIHVKEKYDQVKSLFNKQNGISPVLVSMESWTKNTSIDMRSSAEPPVIDES